MTLLTFSASSSASTEDSIIQELSEKRRIQTHLWKVEELLRSAPTPYLNEEQRENRTIALNYLKAYADSGVFPINSFYDRRPVFKDERDIWCAVGYLLVETGYLAIAEKQVEDDNSFYLDTVQNFESTSLGDWARRYGFEQTELSLIQPTYYGMMPKLVDVIKPITSQSSQPQILQSYLVSGGINLYVLVQHAHQGRELWSLYNINGVFQFSTESVEIREEQKNVLVGPNGEIGWYIFVRKLKPGEVVFRQKTLPGYHCKSAS